MTSVSPNALIYFPRYAGHKPGRTAQGQEDKYKGDLITRLKTLGKGVDHGECFNFFRYQFRIARRNYQHDRFDGNYFDYVMGLLKEAGKKGFKITSLPDEDRLFAARRGYIF